MAYMSQETKKEKAPFIQAILKKYGLKGSLSVSNYSALILTIQSGKIDFFENYNRCRSSLNHNSPISDVFHLKQNDMEVNEYHFQKHYDGIAKECLQELFDIMNKGNHNNSDSQSDYFDIGWYTRITIGKWDKAYTLIV